MAKKSVRGAPTSNGYHNQAHAEPKYQISQPLICLPKGRRCGIGERFTGNVSPASSRQAQLSLRVLASPASNHNFLYFTSSALGVGRQASFRTVNGNSYQILAMQAFARRNLPNADYGMAEHLLEIEFAIERTLVMSEKYAIGIDRTTSPDTGKEKGTDVSARKILVVDSDSSAIEMMKKELQSASYAVFAASNKDEAIEACKGEIFDLCILDLRLASANGISVMTELHSINPELPVLIVTKPFDPAELLLKIRKALEHRRLNSEPQSLKSRLRGKYHLDAIVAKSEKMKNVLDVVSRIAKAEATVYLHGESGTGKEVIAKAIHLESDRRDKPFVAINCAALPEQLLESELFGHEKGAFTGADRSTRGLFMQADEGSILLDEIGDMPLSIQAKLLRVLQERQFYPVGGEKPVTVDVRIMVATNKDLREEVKKGLFREDLFYRLFVVPIRLPPLRERKEDILPLADHFLDKVSGQMKKNVKGFTPEALEKLLVYDWPGNVRELENTIECAVALTRQEMLTAEFVLFLQSTNFRQQEPENEYSQVAEFRDGTVKSYKEARYRFEREYLIHLLELSRGKASQAAKLAEKSRTDFYELLKKHGIRIDAFKKSIYSSSPIFLPFCL